MHTPDDFSQPYQLTIDGVRIDLTRGGTTSFPEYGTRDAMRAWLLYSDAASLTTSTLWVAAQERASVKRSAYLCMMDIIQRRPRYSALSQMRYAAATNCAPRFAQLPRFTYDPHLTMHFCFPREWNVEIFRKGRAFFRPQKTNARELVLLLNARVGYDFREECCTLQFRGDALTPSQTDWRVASEGEYR